MAGGPCYSRAARDAFALGGFTRVFPASSQALKDVERLLLDSGLRIGVEERWGYFFAGRSARHVRARSAYGDGHIDYRPWSTDEVGDSMADRNDPPTPATNASEECFGEISV